MAKLKNGQEIKVVLPFQYTIGEIYLTGKRLKTVQDCIDEARAELEQTGADEFYMEAFNEDGELL